MKKCVYCPDGFGITRDHVPPELFYGKLHQPNVPKPWVPCCEACRLEYQSGDAVMRNLLAAITETEDHFAMRRHAAPTAHASMQDDSRLRNDMLQRVSFMWRQTSETTWLYDMAINLGGPTVEKWFSRVARAITHYSWSTGYWPGEVFAMRDTNQLPLVHEHLPKWGNTKELEGILDYVIYHHPEDEDFWISVRMFGGSYWLLRCIPQRGTIRYPKRNSE